jgi:hypothetical protein
MGKQWPDSQRRMIMAAALVGAALLLIKYRQNSNQRDPLSPPTFSVSFSNSGSTFHDYLPASPAPQKNTCAIVAGSYQVIAKPWLLDGGKWMFLNFGQKPKDCSFSLGYVATEESKSLTAALQDLTPSQRPIPQVTTPNSDEEFAAAFATWYATKENYDAVSRDVISWFGQTKIGCVAFLSTALRFMGVALPVNGIYEGDLLSLDTKPFVNHLLNELHWQKIENLAEGKPGDIGVTVDDSVFRGYPTHVYMLSRWISQPESVVEVIDNQGFAHPRTLQTTPANISKYGEFDPTAYFIRPSMPLASR